MEKYKPFISEGVVSLVGDGGKENILVTQKEILFISHLLTRIYLIISRHLIIRPELIIFKIKETEIYNQGKKSLKFIIVDISQL